MNKFIKKWYKEFFGALAMLIVVGIVTNMFFDKYIVAVSKTQTQFLIIFVTYSVYFSILYFCSHKFRDVIDKHAAVVSILSLTLPLAFVVFQLATTLVFESIAAENSIKQATDLNYKFMESFIGLDVENQTKPIFLDLNSEAYKKYLEYVSKNYSEICLGKYISATLSIDQFNVLSQQRRELSLINFQTEDVQKIKMINEANKGYVLMQLNLASSTMQALSYVMQHCQDFKQRH